MKFTVDDTDLHREFAIGKISFAHAINIVRNDAILQAYSSLLNSKKSTTIQTETHTITVTIRKKRVKK